jgi:hypothetical protein
MTEFAKDKECEQKLVTILRRDFLAETDVVSAGSRLFHDLRIYGDDAVALLNTIADEFDITTLEVDFSLYFPGEGLVPALMPSLYTNYQELTVHDLALIIAAHRPSHPEGD